MALSRPVAFQKPAAVARFVRVPVGYFLSLWLKKYQSFCGPDPILHFSAARIYHRSVTTHDADDEQQQGEQIVHQHYNSSAVRSHRSIEVTGAAVQVGATNGIEDLSWMEPWRPVKTITSSYPIDPWP
jgi:hypothetical protein